MSRYKSRKQEQKFLKKKPKGSCSDRRERKLANGIDPCSEHWHNPTKKRA
jgi:hypothetical protein